MLHMIEFITSILGLITAVVSIVLVKIQYDSHQQEQKAYRQQLISLLHHAEGLRDSINSVGFSMLTGNQNPAEQALRMQLYQTLESIKQNASALFFGIMETKVGGKQILDDLDSKYKKWSSLELDRKISAAEASVKTTKKYLNQKPDTSNSEL